jgi:hypothetical protein
VERAARPQRPEAEPVVDKAPKPPKMDEQLGAIREVLLDVVAKLGPIKLDIEKLKDGFGKQDGRWAVLGAVSQALNSAMAGSQLLAQARAYLEDMSRGVHGTSGKTMPVSSRAVADGKADYENSTRGPRVPTMESLAFSLQHEAQADHREKEELEQSKRMAYGEVPKKGLGGRKL